MIALKDMVVILPGIMGSVLQKDGKDIWAVSGVPIAKIVASLGGNLDALILQGDDPDREDLGDGIKAVRLIDDVQIIPGIIKIDGYTKTTKTITDNFTNVMQGDIYNDPDDKAANLYHFPYDWRRDNRASAKILKRLLDKRLKCWREFTGNPNAKVILLAHSMGGLISRYYLEVLGGWPDCKALFTFGTPYRGSLMAVNYLANGYKKAVFDLSKVVRSLTSIYQLLPRYKVLKVEGKFYRVAESPVDLPNIDRTKALDALNFHNEIDDAADINWQNPLHRANFVTCPIVGVVQPTLQSAEFAGGKVTASPTLPDFLQDRPYLADGDGTVPQVSATPLQMNDIETLAITDYIPESHGAIQGQPDVLLNLLKGLQRVETPSTQDAKGAIEGVARGTRSAIKGIGLSLDDAYLLGEAITMRAKVIGEESFNVLTAEITSVSPGGTHITANFTPDNGEWSLTTDPLPVGQYRVKVQTDRGDFTPVHNLFEVVAPGE
jgi:pimeloyl-ACP methyl ester carboxylesterase